MKNVEKVFEMLGVKPNEVFEIEDCNELVKIDINSLGKIDTDLIYYFSNNGSDWYKDDENMLRALLVGEYKIIKIPLLTDKEKEFLKCFGFDKLKKVKGYGVYKAITFYIVTNGGCRYRILDILGFNALKLKFNGLEFDKEYTKEELGL